MKELICLICGTEFEGRPGDDCPECASNETIDINDYYEAQAQNERDDYLEDKRLFGEN